MHRTSIGVLAAMSYIAFAAADKGSGASAVAAPVAVPEPAAVPAAAPTAKADKPKPEMTSIIDDFPLPTKRLSGGRGGKTLYDFDKLEIGQSFGVKNKTVKGMASTVSSANERYREVIKDGEGKPVMIPDPKDATKQVEATRQTRKFICGEVDPKDPRNDGATVRVWRVALDYKG